MSHPPEYLVAGATNASYAFVRQCLRTNHHHMMEQELTLEDQEIERLDLTDIDVDELERRIEMSDITPGGYFCGCDGSFSQPQPRVPQPKLPAT
jgi:hypothetical protein